VSHPLRLWPIFCARKVELGLGETKPLHPKAGVTHSILQTRKWSIKKEEEVIYPSTGRQM